MGIKKDGFLGFKRIAVFLCLFLCVSIFFDDISVFASENVRNSEVLTEVKDAGLNYEEEYEESDEPDLKNQSLIDAESSAAKGTKNKAGKNEESRNEEFRAVWIAYYDFDDSKGMNKTDFTDYVATMFENVASWGMNAVVVHVRPFGDAMYKSEYYPWSEYASGKQGVNPGYDPLKIMVENDTLEDWLWEWKEEISGCSLELFIRLETNRALAKR